MVTGLNGDGDGMGPMMVMESVSGDRLCGDRICE